ncbi:MAG: hypothetical protein H0T72_14490 [Chloroflexia bacterium]|nr:hypothetical protein [Chloroflexia bacterium]
MSAWIVFPDHISYLVACALDLAPDGFLTFGDGKVLTPHSKDEIGQLLMNENARSVGYRYERDTFEELPGPVDKSGILDYHHSELDLPFDPIVLLKQLDCYAYQTCECPDWPQIDAYDFCEVVRGLAEATLPPSLRHYEHSRWSSSSHHVPAYRNSEAYDDAPWGIGPELRRGQ